MEPRGQEISNGYFGVVGQGRFPLRRMICLEGLEKELSPQRLRDVVAWIKGLKPPGR